MANNYTGEPAMDRQPDSPPAPNCLACGGPCRLDAADRDGSWFSNDPNGLAAAIARRHKRVTPAWIADVERQRVLIRALALAPTFPCLSCGKFAFDRRGVVCFWCRNGNGIIRAHNPPPIQPIIQAPKATPPPGPGDLFATLAPQSRGV